MITRKEGWRKKGIDIVELVVVDEIDEETESEDSRDDDYES